MRRHCGACLYHDARLLLGGGRYRRIGNEEVGFQIFLRAIPFNYYAILTLVFIIVMTCLNIDYGPMRTHELNAAKGDLYTTPERPFADATEMKFNPNGKVIDLVIPVIILIIGCVSSMIYVGFQNGGHDLITAFANTSAFDALPLGSLNSPDHQHDLFHGAPLHEVHRTDGLAEGFRRWFRHPVAVPGLDYRRRCRALGAPVRGRHR